VAHACLVLAHKAQAAGGLSGWCMMPGLSMPRLAFLQAMLQVGAFLQALLQVGAV